VRTGYTTCRDGFELMPHWVPFHFISLLLFFLSLVCSYFRGGALH
jgi:hypothetical protein